ncbi:MAG: hypothetical protein RLZZ414_250 [Bacteroidota bacterium]|jgi:hypothetical protein
MSQVNTNTENRKYYLNTQEVESNCNAIIFINTGRANVFINGQKLTPNDYLNVSQDFNKIDKTLYKINFQRSSFYDSWTGSYELTVIKSYNSNMSK